jgi:hypothetical protein
MTSHFERQIDIDVSRTQRHHSLFQMRYGEGQTSLFNILRAFANYNPEIGYCQGMANIGAFLLIQFKEEEVFCMFTKLMMDYNLGKLYAPEFPSLITSFLIHDHLLKLHLSILHTHFIQHNVRTSHYLTKWMLNIYLCFPFHTCLRIWDLFILFRFDILHYIAIGILKYLKKQLLRLDFEGMMKLLTETHHLELEDDRLLFHIRKIFGTYGQKGSVELTSQPHQLP